MECSLRRTDAGARELNIGMWLWKNAVSGQRADVDIVIFSAKSCALQVIDNAEGESLSAIMKRQKYVCGVNGGYFDRGV